jgi:hypothetical protein
VISKFVCINSTTVTYHVYVYDKIYLLHQSTMLYVSKGSTYILDQCLQKFGKRYIYITQKKVKHLVASIIPRCFYIYMCISINLYQSKLCCCQSNKHVLHKHDNKANLKKCLMIFWIGVCNQVMMQLLIL